MSGTVPSHAPRGRGFDSTRSHSHRRVWTQGQERSKRHTQGSGIGTSHGLENTKQGQEYTYIHTYIHPYTVKGVHTERRYLPTVWKTQNRARNIHTYIHTYTHIRSKRYTQSVGVFPRSGKHETGPETVKGVTNGQRSTHRE